MKFPACTGISYSNLIYYFKTTLQIIFLPLYPAARTAVIGLAAPSTAPVMGRPMEEGGIAPWRRPAIVPTLAAVGGGRLP